MDDGLKQTICQLIAGIVIADEDLDPREEAFVGRVLQRFAVEEDQRDVIFPLVDREEAACTMRELPEAVQREAFELLVGAACADGKVVAEEREYLATVATAIGVAAADVERMIETELAKG